MPANPIPGPYTVSATTYHTGPALYNKSVLATAPFLATGSYANPVALITSGSTPVVVRLVSGGEVSLTSTTNPISLNVYSVVSGSAYLLYN